MRQSILALGYAFCWGIGLTLAKLALQGIAPTTLLLIQLLSSVLFLLTLQLAVRLWRQGLGADWRTCWSGSVRRWHSLRQGKAGIFEPALAYLCGTIGLEMTSATNAALLGATEVVLTILLAALLLGERLTLAKLGLASLSFSGIALLMGQESAGQQIADQPTGGPSSLLGDSLILLGVLFAVVYVLISKHQIAQNPGRTGAIGRPLGPLALTTAQQIVGLATTVLGSAILSVINPIFEVNAASITLQFWLLAILSGVLQYALAFLLYITALQQVQVSQAAFYVALIPVFGVGSAIALLGERPSWIQAIGAVLIIGSSYLANHLAQPAAPDPGPDPGHSNHPNDC